MNSAPQKEDFEHIVEEIKEILREKLKDFKLKHSASTSKDKTSEVKELIELARKYRLLIE